LPLAPVVSSGGSRGIGLGIRIDAARQGAHVVLLAKTDIPHPRLPGTVHTAAAEVEAAGAEVLHSVEVADLSCYGGGDQPIPDLFLD
jgi:NAD(P)-dependent dehydrogenase (short-subunit alcohol dehydrogenase family)